MDATACGQAGHLVEVAPPDRAAFGTREDERAGLVLGEGGEMSAQGRDDRLGNADDASTSLGLGRPEEHFAGGPFDVRGPDPDRACIQVEIAPPKRGHLAPPEAGERGEQHQGVEPAVLRAVGAAVTSHCPQRPFGLGPAWRTPLVTCASRRARRNRSR